MMVAAASGGGARARAAVRPSVRAHPPTRCTCARVCRCRHMTRTKLEMAFAELRCRGILAYHNFKCCGTCGERTEPNRSGKWGRRSFDGLID